VNGSKVAILNNKCIY